ncbi:MAG: hypothetical protein ACKV0T_06065 [Planctomycetales bacterium]
MQDELNTPIRFADRGDWWRGLVFAWRNALGHCLAAIPLHRWSSPAQSPAGWKCKARVAWCESLLPLGNLYLQLQGAPSEVLSTPAWLRREACLAEALGRRIQVQPQRRGFLMAMLPGTGLDTILAGSSSQTLKLEGVRLAAAALRRLHTMSLPPADGESEMVSHGDATCRNVVVDLDSGTAHWVDFDTRHRPELSLLERRSDDLRTLLLSSVASQAEGGDFEIARAVFAGYDDETVEERVRLSLTRRLYPSAFHAAQAPLSWSRFRRLRLLLAIG